MQIIPTAPNLNSRMRKFKYVVINGGQNQEPQTAMAPNPQYLKQLLEMNGDRVQILEELTPDEETRNYGKMDVKKALQRPDGRSWAAGGSLGAGTLMNVGASEEQIKALQAMHGGSPAAEQPAPRTPVQQTQVQPVQPAPRTPNPVPQTQYFKIGSTECKMENGKVYQKQWMRVNENEMQNYRLISDKNNKILPMTGKHLEMLKWVISEDSEETA